MGAAHGWPSAELTHGFCIATDLLHNNENTFPITKSQKRFREESHITICLTDGEAEAQKPQQLAQAKSNF